MGEQDKDGGLLKLEDDTGQLHQLKESCLNNVKGISSNLPTIHA